MGIAYNFRFAEVSKKHWFPRWVNVDLCQAPAVFIIDNLGVALTCHLELTFERNVTRIFCRKLSKHLYKTRILIRDDASLTTSRPDYRCVCVSVEGRGVHWTPAFCVNMDVPRKWVCFMGNGSLSLFSIVLTRGVFLGQKPILYHFFHSPCLKQGEWTSLVLNRISPGGEGYSWEFSLGVCRSTLFHTNLKCHFPHPFSDLEEITKRNMFTKTEIISSLLRLKRRQKDFLKFILNSHTSCGVISYSSGTIRQICSYATVVPSKTIPVFRPKRRKNHTLWCGTYLYGLSKGVPPGTIVINRTLARVRRP